MTSLKLLKPKRPKGLQTHSPGRQESCQLFHPGWAGWGEAAAWWVLTVGQQDRQQPTADLRKAARRDSRETNCSQPLSAVFGRNPEWVRWEWRGVNWCFSESSPARLHLKKVHPCYICSSILISEIQFPCQPWMTCLSSIAKPNPSWLVRGHGNSLPCRWLICFWVRL